MNLSYTWSNQSNSEQIWFTKAGIVLLLSPRNKRLTDSVLRNRTKVGSALRANQKPQITARDSSRTHHRVYNQTTHVSPLSSFPKILINSLWTARPYQSTIYHREIFNCVLAAVRGSVVFIWIIDGRGVYFSVYARHNNIITRSALTNWIDSNLFFSCRPRGML